MLGSMLALGILLLGATSLQWDAPPECPTRAEVLARARAQSDAEPPEDPPAMRGTVRRRDDDRWWLELEIDNGRAVERRTMSAQSCEELTDAAALIIAMRWVTPLGSTSRPGSAEEDALVVPEPTSLVGASGDGSSSESAASIDGDDDGDGSTTAKPPIAKPAGASSVDPNVDPNVDPSTAPITTPSTAPSTAPTVVGPDRSANAAANRSTTASAGEAPRPEPLRALGWGGWVALGGGVALGILPGVGGAVALEGGVDGPRWQAGLSVRGFPLREVNHPQTSMISGRFDLVTAGALGCGVPGVRRVSFPLCGRVELGALRGLGQGAVTVPRPQWSLWAGLAASAAIRWRVLRWLAPFVALEGQVALLRPGFTVGTVPGTLFEAGLFGLRAWGGIALHLEIRSTKNRPG